MGAAPDLAWGRACQFSKGKMGEVAALTADEIHSKCDKNIGAEADRITQEERSSNASACVYAYQVAKSEAEKYLTMRQEHCAETYNKSMSRTSSCSNQPGDGAQAVCLEKIVANLKEAAALETKLENALRLAKASADAAAKYNNTAKQTLLETETLISNAVSAEMAKAIDANDGKLAAQTVREATVISGGALRVGGAGEVRATQAGPGVSTISGFKEKVPGMIEQQQVAAKIAADFSAEATERARLHSENVKKFNEYAEDAAAKARALRTAGSGISKSEDDSIPIPRPKPQIEQESPAVETGTNTLSRDTNGTIANGNDSGQNNSRTISNSDPVAESPGYSSPGAPQGNSFLPAMAGAAGSAEAVVGALANQPRRASTLGLEGGVQTDSASPLVKSTATNLTNKLAQTPTAVDAADPTKTEQAAIVAAGAEMAGGQVGITGLAANSPGVGNLMTGTSRLGSVDSRGFSASGGGKLLGGKSNTNAATDPGVKSFQTNLAEGGVPIKSSDLNSAFDSFASEFGVDPSVGLTAEEQEAFASLQNSDRDPVAGGEKAREPSSQFDASVEGTEGKALFVRTKLALVRAVKKGLLIQNLKNKL
jgi:hypothetical protein